MTAKTVPRRKSYAKAKKKKKKREEKSKEEEEEENEGLYEAGGGGWTIGSVFWPEELLGGENHWAGW